MCLDTSIQCALHNLHVRLANNYHFAVPLQTAFNWCSVSLEATLYLALTSEDRSPNLEPMLSSHADTPACILLASFFFCMLHPPHNRVVTFSS